MTFHRQKQLSTMTISEVWTELTSTQKALMVAQTARILRVCLYVSNLQEDKAAELTLQN
jgi:hypothetical protein